MKIKRYSELVRLETFKERFDYLKLDGSVGEPTFGFDRYLNQEFYCSKEWKETRRKVIIRDNGCDLAFDDHVIGKYIVIHHLNPITMEQIENRDPVIFDPENLVCVSRNTHNAIHYGDWDLIPKGLVERKPNDTCPWKVTT